MCAESAGVCIWREITSSSFTESVPLPMPPKITVAVVLLGTPLLLAVVVVVVVGNKVPFGPRPNINEVARRPATFDARPEIAADRARDQCDTKHKVIIFYSTVSSIHLSCYVFVYRRMNMCTRHNKR